MEQKQPNIQTREDACRWAVMRVRALIADEADWVTNLANASAAIFECWKEVSWAGFYLMKKGSWCWDRSRENRLAAALQWAKEYAGPLRQNKKHSW